MRVPRDSHRLVASAIERAKSAVAARQRVRVDRPIDGRPAGSPAGTPNEQAVEPSAASSSPRRDRGLLPGAAGLDVAKRLHGDARSKPVTAPPGTAMAARDFDPGAGAGPTRSPGAGPGATRSPAIRTALQALRGRGTQLALALLLIAAAVLIVMEIGRRANERMNERMIDRPPPPVSAPGTAASRGSADITNRPPEQAALAPAAPRQPLTTMALHAPPSDALHPPPGEALRTPPNDALHAPPGEAPPAPPNDALHAPLHDALPAPLHEALPAPPREQVAGRARSPAPDPTHRPAQPVKPPRDPAARTSRPSAAVAGAGSLGELDRPTIQRYVNRYLDRIKYCYEQRRLAAPALAGTVQAEFLITPGGSVASSTATGLDAEVAGCVARVIKDIEFPRSGDSVDVKYPFRFVPSD